MIHLEARQDFLVAMALLALTSHDPDLPKMDNGTAFQAQKIITSIKHQHHERILLGSQTDPMRVSWMLVWELNDMSRTDVGVRRIPVDKSR